MHKKWNISLLVLFILVASSLLWILAFQYVKHIAVQTTQIHNYYKAYYLAKWGSEIWLSLMKIRKEWFSRNIDNNDKIISQNISSWLQLSIKIQWKSDFLSAWHPDDTECNNPIIIGSWQSFILPLFIDQPSKKAQEIFSENIYYQNLSEWLESLQITGISESRNVNLWIIISSEWELTGAYFTGKSLYWNVFEEFVKNIKSFYSATIDPAFSDRQHWDLQNYLIIANTEKRNLEFCLQSQQELSLEKTYISSFGEITTEKIWLETIFQQPIPSYLIESSPLTSDPL